MQQDQSLSTHKQEDLQLVFLHTAKSSIARKESIRPHMRLHVHRIGIVGLTPERAGYFDVRAAAYACRCDLSSRKWPQMFSDPRHRSLTTMLFICYGCFLFAHQTGFNEEAWGSCFTEKLLPSLDANQHYLKSGALFTKSVITVGRTFVVRVVEVRLWGNHCECQHHFTYGGNSLEEVRILYRRITEQPGLAILSTLYRPLRP